jgi:hypothetical protein
LTFLNKHGYDWPMFIRQAKIGNAASGESYFTFRLVASERIGGKVRQQTLLNLGRNFTLSREHWPELCRRIEQILSGQMSLMPATAKIETLAQRYAARLSSWRRPDAAATSEADYQEVDTNSLELIRPRSIGVEHAGMAALDWLDFSSILTSVGFNGPNGQRPSAVSLAAWRRRGASWPPGAGCGSGAAWVNCSMSISSLCR